MSNNEDLFTKEQNRLMNIAGWANSLAWITLVIYLLAAALTIFIDQADYQRMQAIVSSPGGSSDYWEMALSNPLYYIIDVGSDLLIRALTGFINYVVLKGISLGLYMVIETDMNYRDRENMEGKS